MTVLSFQHLKGLKTFEVIRWYSFRSHHTIYNV